jgi:hypothetical protein
MNNVRPAVQQNPSNVTSTRFFIQKKHSLAYANYNNAESH